MKVLSLINETICLESYETSGTRGISTKAYCLDLSIIKQKTTRVLAHTLCLPYSNYSNIDGVSDKRAE